MRRVSLWALWLVPLIFIGCSGEDERRETSHRSIPVYTAKAAREKAERTLALVGHVEASASVRLASQVTGQLMEVLVEPGHYVEAGQLIFRLDQRTFQAALNQARAALDRDTAQLTRARRDLDRYKSLVSKNHVTQQQYELSLSEVASLEATINLNTAAVESAQVQLGYTDIVAPISGRTGAILIDPGNIVRENDMPILIINTISPAEVSFAVPERHLPELNRRLRQGAVEVEVLPEGDQGDPVRGLLTTIDNTVNRETGAVAMRARFDNADERLWPGQFVRVSITMEEIPEALVIPFRAALEGLSGQYVYLTSQEEEGAAPTVEPRQVRAVLLDKARLQVLEGLEEGDEVVVDGQLNLYPGARVEILPDPENLR